MAPVASKPFRLNSIDIMRRRGLFRETEGEEEGRKRKKERKKGGESNGRRLKKKKERKKKNHGAKENR